jgi:cell division protein FtsB
MTGIEVPAQRAAPPRRAPRLRLPATRGGLAWVLVLVIVGGVLAVQVGRQVYQNYAITERAAALQAQIADVQAQNAQLQRELDYLRSDAYVAAEARRLSNLGSTGDRLLIIPPGAEAPLPASLQPTASAQRPLLQQWLDLFFGS